MLLMRLLRVIVVLAPVAFKALAHFLPCPLVCIQAKCMCAVHDALEDVAREAGRKAHKLLE